MGVFWVVAKVGGKPSPIVVAGGLQLQSRQCNETDAGSCRNWGVPRDYGEKQGMTHARSAVALPSDGGIGDSQTEGKVSRRDVAEWIPE